MMSLIGNCQSAKAFCTQNTTYVCSENKIEKISNEQAKQLLKDFGHFISKYNQNLQKHFAFLFTNQQIDFTGEISKKAESSNSEQIFKIHKKTSKVRNKDHLDTIVLN